MNVAYQDTASSISVVYSLCHCRWRENVIRINNTHPPGKAVAGISQPSANHAQFNSSRDERGCAKRRYICTIHIWDGIYQRAYIYPSARNFFSGWQCRIVWRRRGTFASGSLLLFQQQPALTERTCPNIAKFLQH